MAEELVKILNGPLGLNTVDDPKSSAFQPASKSKPEPQLLTRADNVDVSRTGGHRRRAGRIKLRALTDGHSLYSSPEGLLYADGSTLYRYYPTSDAVVTTALCSHEEVSFETVAGQVFWCNGTARGRISGGVDSPWGLAIADPPILTAAAGALRAGSYLVAIAPVSDDGVEGGCRGASTMALSTGGGIAVSPTGVDSRAAALSVWLSDTNGRDLFYHSTAPVGPVTITSPAPTTRLFDGLGGFPPPAGHIVCQWDGRLVVAQDSLIFFSEPASAFRFHLQTDLQAFPSRVAMLAAVTDGLYVGTETGLFFLSGDPRNLTARQLDTKRVSEQRNTLYVPARKLPWLQADVDLSVPIWADEDGWVAGLPGGAVRHPVDGRVAMDSSRRATMSYVERPGLRQLLLAARDKVGGSQMGFGDRVTATVTRGGASTT